MKNKILLSLFSITVFMVLTSGVNDDNGKAGRTGSPNEQNCTNGCHNSFALNSGPATIAITSNMTNWEYVPGQTYSISVAVAQTGFNLYGIGCEALTAANQNGGTLIAGTGTQIKNASVSGVTRKNITHTLNGGAGSGSHTFTFSWTAPASGSGDITFYIANVAANGMNGNQGDYVYTRTQVATEFVAPSGINESKSSVSELNIYPNPIRENFTMSFSLEAQAQVKAAIYSIQGQLLQVISDESLSAGAHVQAVQLNDGISAGNYLLVVSSNNKTISRQIVVR